METTLVKIGNSVSVRLSKPLLEQARLKAGDRVELVVQAGRRVVMVPKRKKPTLADLLKGMKPAHWQPRVDWGGRAGKEPW